MQSSPNRRGFLRNGSLLLVVVVAAIPRLLWPGMWIFWWDEVVLLRRSLRLVALKDWTWLSNPTTWSAIPIHSPFNTYAFSLPYLFTRDPRAVRFFVGVLGVLAVLVLFLTVRRYYGGLAAAISGLLLALSPSAIDWARWVWNPNLAQVFIALWLATGLLGYYEGKQWAQILHWLMLSLAGQAHLGHGFNMLLPSLALLAGAWLHFTDRRREVLRATLIGWALLALSLIPWMIGLVESGIGRNAQSAAAEGARASWEWVKVAFSSLVSSTQFWTIRRVAARDGEWWPPLQSADRVLWLKTYITMLGTIWLLVLLWRKRWQAVPGAMFALAMIWPIISFLVSPIAVAEFYLMPMMFGAYAIQGVALAHLARARRWARWPVFIMVGLFLALQSWLVIGMFRWHDLNGNVERYRASMDTTLNLLESWREEADQVVVLTETNEAKYSPENQVMWWEVLGGYNGPKAVAMPQGIPIYPQGQVLVGSWTGTAIPTLFGEGEPQGVLNDGQPMFRKVLIPAGYSAPLDFEPVTLSRFANGMQIHGLHELSELQPGKPWRVVLVWSHGIESASANYHFSLRVVSGEVTYGQTDALSLAGTLWQPDELILNLFEIPTQADLDPEDMRVQVIVYSWPDMATVSVTDADGNPVEPWLFLAPDDEAEIQSSRSDVMIRRTTGAATWSP